MKKMTHLAPREAVMRSRREQHGAVQDVELAGWGVAPEDAVDFSSNVNPYGPSPTVEAAIKRATIARYPDPQCTDLHAALAAHHGVEPDFILAGNGAAELIWLAALAFVAPLDPVLVIGPTFGEYRRAVQMMGGRIEQIDASEASGFTVPVASVGAALEMCAWRMVFLCNPNNPTGALVAQATVEQWAHRYPSTLFVVDEAYGDFVDGFRSMAAISLENVLVLRSMTKAYALAGLRLGYAIGMPATIDLLQRVAPPWSVNGFAQVAGVAAIGDRRWLQSSLHRLRAATALLTRKLSDLGYSCIPSPTNYFLMHVGDGAAFRRRLMPHGLVVRDCASFALPAYVRIATQRPVQNDRLIAQLESLPL